MRLTREQIDLMQELLVEDIWGIDCAEGMMCVIIDTDDDSVDEYQFFNDGSVRRRLSGGFGASNFCDIIEV